MASLIDQDHCYANNNLNSNTNPMVNGNNDNSIDYFPPNLNTEAKGTACAKITKWMHNEFPDLFQE